METVQSVVERTLERYFGMRRLSLASEVLLQDAEANLNDIEGLIENVARASFCAGRDDMIVEKVEGQEEEAREWLRNR